MLSNSPLDDKFGLDHLDERHWNRELLPIRFAGLLVEWSHLNRGLYMLQDEDARITNGEKSIGFLVDDYHPHLLTMEPWEPVLDVNVIANTPQREIIDGTVPISFSPRDPHAY